MLNIPLDCIGMLHPEERLKLQQEFSHMPAYLFMSDREKRKYFEGKNKEYRKML